MGGFNEGTSGGSGDHRTSKPTSKIGDALRSRTGQVAKIAKFVASGGFTGAIIRGITKSYRQKNKKDKSGNIYSGEAYGYNEAAEKKDYKAPVKKRDRNNTLINNIPKGIELAKASTTSATILGPEEIQKQAANTIKGPTSIEMSAADILLKNKRKGRKATNITSATGLAKNYKLSQKTLLG